MIEADLPAAPLWVSAASRLIQTLPAGRYRAMNWIARRKAPPFWAALPADVGGLVFRCDLRDPLMREVCMTGRYEPQETALIRCFLRPGMTFVDVGANWGYFTLSAAHLVGATGRVVSIEADPRALATLASNVARNALGHVTVIGAAASDGVHTIEARRYGSGNDETSNFGVALLDALDGGNGERTELGAVLEIPAAPLDAMLDAQSIERVDVLKMDIEGAEARALSGLSRRLAHEAVDRIILELHPAHLRNLGTSPETIVEWLQSFGYDAWRIDHAPAAHRRAAATPVDVGSLLTPLAGSGALGAWPHVLFVRRGLSPVGPGFGQMNPPEGGSHKNDLNIQKTP